MSPLRDRLRAFADHRLHSLIATPEIWGSAESVELQVLHLLQVRALVLAPEQDERDPGATREHYVSFLRAHFPDDPPMPLADHFASEPSLERVSALLQQFVQEERARQDGSTPESEVLATSGPSASASGESIEAHGRLSYKRSTIHNPFLDAA